MFLKMAENMGLLDSIPATMPPPGVIPDLTSSYNEMQTPSIFAWTICAFAVITCVALRSFTRFYVIKKIELADCEFAVEITSKVLTISSPAIVRMCKTASHDCPGLFLT